DGALQFGILRRLTSPGRVILNPFVWKDFFFVSGGQAMLLVRIFIYVALYFVAQYLSELWWDGREETVVSTYLVFVNIGMTIDAAYLLSRSIQDEVRGQTLGTLLMLPVSTGGILYPKFVGTLIGWLPGPLSILIATAYFPHGADWLVDLDRSLGPFCLIVAC